MGIIEPMISLPPLLNPISYKADPLLEELCRKAVEQAFNVEEVFLDSEKKHKALLVTLKAELNPAPPKSQ